VDYYALIDIQTIDFYLPSRFMTVYRLKKNYL